MLVTWNLSSRKKQFYFTRDPLQQLLINSTQDAYVVITQCNQLFMIDPKSINLLKQKYKLSSLTMPESSEDAVQRDSRALVVEPLRKRVLLTGSHRIQWYDAVKEVYV